MTSRATAAAVIIGNEVLTGKVRDLNTPVLIDALRRHGVRLQRIVVIEDTLDAIATAVADASAAYTHVFTSGGIGPTHDDLTLAGVARGLGLELHEHPALTSWLVNVPEGPRREALRRLARVPVGTELVQFEGLRFPTMRVKNVWVLPGVPGLFEKKVAGIAALIAEKPVVAATLYCTAAEPDITYLIDAVVSRHPETEIGSYPVFDQADHQTRLTVDGDDVASVDATLADFEASLPVGSVVRIVR
ncbi:MAG: competence/damage-inducible protein A [Myxococcales bacterium]|nr:competence/damage-inducible protein A [Myxococcales bacterium]